MKTKAKKKAKTKAKEKVYVLNLPVKKSDTDPTPVVLPEIKFCDKCHKIVPEEQITYYKPNAFHNGFYMHLYESYENIAPPSTGMNCCMAMRTVICGNIVEPTAEEYFMYITWT